MSSHTLVALSCHCVFLGRRPSVAHLLSSCLGVCGQTRPLTRPTPPGGRSSPLHVDVRHSERGLGNTQGY